MDAQTLERLKYPIGRFTLEGEVTDARRRQWIEEVERLPGEVRRAVEGLDQAQLDTPYRPGGWTLRQVVHHLADAHMHLLLRFKLALTQDEPVISPYDPDALARLADSMKAPVEPSLDLLAGVHRRMVILLRSMREADFARTYRQPARDPVPLDRALALYAWHGRHHTAQIEALRTRMGW